ncbi:tachykinin-like peptides receptor 99D [Penaeus japonicus]|uniref:tachykinin-like peptides receptor 99D n=1 Tax=Penaeus japonicus TaxID=27405 RepID=UPI001C716EB1|nr:tachykinin-like peptides receptor 99D [Penaeus japonicus]
MDLFDSVLDLEREFNVSLRYGSFDSTNDSGALDYAVDDPNGTLFFYPSSSPAFGLNDTGNDTEWVENKYNLPLWRELIWSFVFGSMVLVATGGNLIVIWIVMANRRMRTVTNIFLVNLSVADTMVSTLNVVFNFTYMLNLHWQFGLVYCKISQFVSILSICASVFTLMAISFDRQQLILRRRIMKHLSPLKT